MNHHLTIRVAMTTDVIWVFDNSSSVITEDKDFIRDYHSFYSLFEETDTEKLSPWVLRITLHPLTLHQKRYEHASA